MIDLLGLVLQFAFNECSFVIDGVAFSPNLNEFRFQRIHFLIQFHVAEFLLLLVEFVYFINFFDDSLYVLKLPLENG